MTTLSIGTRIIATALTGIALGGMPMAVAQVTPPGSSAGQDHGVHHPDAKSAPETKPGMAPPTGQGGMMRGDMMQSDMRRMMSMPGFSPRLGSAIQPPRGNVSGH